MVKIMHFADVHLDSPFTLENVERSSERRRELRDTFKRAIDYAAHNRVQLLLLPGDLLEYEHLSPDTSDLLRESFASIPKTKVVIAPGNHDYYSENCIYKKVDFTDNVFFFRRPEVSKISFDDIGVDVYGYAFCSKFFDRHPLGAFSPDDPDKINILCAHLDLNSTSRSCPVSESELAATNVDYAALGHIHNGGEVKKAGNVTYAYSGCLEGRDFGECGYKGALVGTIEKEGGRAKIDIEPVRFSARRYMVERVGVTGARSNEDIINALREKIASYTDDTLLRVIIEGDVDPEVSIKDIDIRAAFPAPYTIETIDKTLPLFAYETLRDDPTIKGAFFRMLLTDLQSEDPHKREVAAAALKYGLDALANRDIM